MNFNYFKLLIFIMCIALFGIITFQINWLNNAVIFKREALRKDVDLVLNNVVLELEKQENEKVGNMKLPDNTDVTGVMLSVINTETYIYSLGKKNSLINNVGVIKNNVSSHSNYYSKNLKMNLVDAHLQTLKKDNNTDFLNAVVSGIMLQYIEKAGAAKIRIDSVLWKKIIETELNKKGINIEFDFAIYDTLERKWTYLSNQLIPKSPNYFSYQTQLFPNDINPNAEYLKFQFKKEKNYVYNSLMIQFLLSFLFVIIIIGIFFAAIKIIYNQKKLSDIKNDFINNMTHEIKTPIATISLAADTIINEAIIHNPEKVKQYIHIVKQENKRMNDHIENILQYALVEKHDFKLQREPVNIHELLEEAIGHIRLQVESRGGKIIAALNASKVEMMVDKFHLKNALMNLLDNANKYSRNSPEIRVSTFNEKEELILEISDNGIGIKPEDQLRVFDKFYRVSTGDIHTVKGFGLGLSYVKSIVDAHHGKIAIYSDAGKGSTFRIKLNYF